MPKKKKSNKGANRNGSQAGTEKDLTTNQRPADRKKCL